MVLLLILGALGAVYLGLQIGLLAAMNNSNEDTGRCLAPDLRSREFTTLNQLRIRGEHQRDTQGGTSQFAAIMIRNEDGQAIYDQVLNLRGLPRNVHTEQAILGRADFQQQLNGGHAVLCFIYSHNSPCHLRADGVVSCAAGIRELARTHPGTQFVIGFMEYFYRSGDTTRRRHDPAGRERDVRAAIFAQEALPNLRYMRIWLEGTVLQAGWIRSTEDSIYEGIIATVVPNNPPQCSASE